jgi:hypothetical protein
MHALAGNRDVLKIIQANVMGMAQLSKVQLLIMGLLN